MIKSFKVMLIPNDKQRSQLFNYAGAARFAYNWALRKEMDSLSRDGLYITCGDLRKEFTQLKKTPEFSWLNSIDCNVTKQAIKDLDKAYSQFFKLRKKKGYKPYSKKFLDHIKRIGWTPTFYQSNGHPKFKVKKDYRDYGFYQDTAKISFSDTHVKLVLIAGKGKSGSKRGKIFCRVRLAEHNRIPIDAKYMNPRITYDGINWWISVSIEMPQNDKYVPYNEGVGIDLGIKDLAICSDGNTYKNINKSKKIKKLEKKKRRLQRSISRKYERNKKGESYCKTKNIIKKEKLLLKIEHKLTNIRDNYLHQITSEIINREPRFIVLEDLNASGMMKNKHLSKAIQSQRFRDFRRQIEYKSSKINIQVIIADRYYPSSKTCNCCGHIKKDLKLSDRIYKCDSCGYIEDRDLNAALNLKDYGSMLLAV